MSSLTQSNYEITSILQCRLWFTVLLCSKKIDPFELFCILSGIVLVWKEKHCCMWSTNIWICFGNGDMFVSLRVVLHVLKLNFAIAVVWEGEKVFDRRERRWLAATVNATTSCKVWIMTQNSNKYLSSVFCCFHKKIKENVTLMPLPVGKFELWQQQKPKKYVFLKKPCSDSFFWRSVFFVKNKTMLTSLSFISSFELSTEY